MKLRVLAFAVFGTALTACQAPSGPASSPSASQFTTAQAAPTASSGPTAIPSPSSSDSPSTGATGQEIVALAASSACASTSWANRGRAPAGFIEGMALTFARSECRLLGHSTLNAAAEVMAQANSGNTSADALAYYGIGASQSGEAALISDFTLGVGLGMRESSGEYCMGWDTTAGSNRSSSQAEAGLFQVSYDSMGASPELQALFDEYQAHPSNCLLTQFESGVSCGSQSILGTGAGAAFQSFTRSCPAFAAEYAMILLRVLRSHFGPIIRKEAEYVAACEKLFSDVRTKIDSNPAAACQNLS